MKKSSIVTLVGALILIALIVVVVLVVRPGKRSTDDQDTIAMCYQYSHKTTNDLTDRAWLRMNIDGDQVTGEYRNLPAEKDSKVGTFSGTVHAVYPQTSSRIADVVWNTEAEGMSAKEQLRIEFGEGSAVALFGAMKDAGDGTYVYADPAHLTPGFQMSQVDCSRLNETFAVESYIRTNIARLANEDATLGGTWYVNSIDVDAIAHNGSVTYEDGHVSRFAIFTYTYDTSSNKVSITSFSGADK